MALANFDLNALRAKVIAAFNADDPIVARFREYAKGLAGDIRPLRSYSVNAVSFVSADGGDNRLSFNPSVIELIRVVDSRGNECALDAVASSAQPKELDERGRSGNSNTVAPLERLCAAIGLPVTKLSYLLGSL